MEEIKKANQYLMDFFDNLIQLKSIYDVSNIDIKIHTGSNYRQKDLEDDSFKKEFQPMTYSIDATFYINKGFNGAYLHTAAHDSLFKCIKEVEFRVDNELRLQKSLADFKHKLSTETFDELSLLKDEFQRAVDNEDYEKAEELKKKIAKLEKKQKSPKKK